MDVMYENEAYKILADKSNDVYLIVNKSTGHVEVREPVLPTAKFKAHALLGALKQFEALEDK